MARREMDLARSVQVVTEEIVLKQVAHAARITGEKNLCLAGGVALNCVANGRILRESPFENVWIQPAAGDAGGALGAALHIWHQVQDNPRTVDGKTDSMGGAYLGPAYPDDQIAAWLDHQGFPYRSLADGDLEDEVARLVEDQKVVGLFQGRMEFGPRALGNRSIIGDARSARMQSVLNLKIKYRESFRPFAPSCMEERIGDFFDIDRPSPYMLLVAQVQPGRCLPPEESDDGTDLFKRVSRPRSDVPAITHVDYSARIQSVSSQTNPRYHRIIQAFEKRTGYGIIINTSFNVRGEPIVCTPEDAYRCFMRTEMDFLALGNHILDKTAQPAMDIEKEAWQEEFPLD
jgi:carbamoyltransferase